MSQTCNQTIIEIASSDLYWKVAIALFLACVAYNWLIDSTFNAGYERDTTVWFVCGGVLMVTAGFGIVYGLEAALISLSLFTVTGVPMILGAFRRNMKAKAADNQEFTEAIKVNLSVLSDKIFKKD